MESSRWHVIIGPAITLTLAGMTLGAERYLFRVPNPGAILFLAVAFSGYLGGIGSGLISAGISFAFAAVYFSAPGALFNFKPDDLSRMLVLSICTPAIAIMMGILQARAQKALERERSLTRELKPLRAALDQSEVGVALLDSDLQTQFANRAFRRLWRLPDEVANRKPAFAELLRRSREANHHGVPADQIDTYMAERMRLVRCGDEKPVDIKLASGEVARCRCKALSDGGRMLTYGNVSDLIRNVEELGALAMKDALTGIHNRRHFMARLESEWNRYRRYQRPLSLLILDIDLFKSINDRFGHDVGDQVIKYVAGLCELQTRDSDVEARIGGEEFAILLPETELGEALVVAERLRITVAERPVPGGSDLVAVTVSIGVAQAQLTMLDPAALMKRADEVLYAAKRGGRNRVVAASDDNVRHLETQVTPPASAA